MRLVKCLPPFPLPCAPKRARFSRDCEIVGMVRTDGCFRKPLVDSGTSGTQCESSTVQPALTLGWGADAADPTQETFEVPYPPSISFSSCLPAP